MFLDAEMQLAYKVGNAPFNMFPYPHFYVPDVFPKAFYDDIQRNLPEPRDLRPIAEARSVKGYDERFVLGMHDKDLTVLPDSKREFWAGFMRWFVGAHFRDLILRKFKPFIDQRFAGKSEVMFHDEALLVQDITNYKLGPHTDALRKVVTLLFYLPPDESQSHLGTSIYVPNDPEFTCPGGPHHDHSKFTRLHTNPFLPNSMFAFFKTNNSFHGVEPIADPGTRRWLLLYDIFVREEKPGKAPEKAAITVRPRVTVTPAPAPQKSKVKFTF